MADLTMLQRADEVFRHSVREASGYLDLAGFAREAGRSDQAMRDAAIKALQRFSDDDDLIDAMRAEEEGWDWEPTNG